MQALAKAEDTQASISIIRAGRGYRGTAYPGCGFILGKKNPIKFKQYSMWSKTETYKTIETEIE